MPGLHRRALIACGSALLGTGLVSGLPGRALGRAHFDGNPFTLGVASGFPLPDSVVLWTRLAPTPLAPAGGMDPEILPVTWEIAGDDRMRRIVQSGTAYATPDWGHSLHVEPAGLEPDREYWYRFRVGDAESPIGRTRTAPGFRASPDRLRLALASCQQYEHGYYAAYRHMLDDELDLIVHVGDYIYELSWGTERVRQHNTHECYTLDDYRARYGLYKSDSDLQSAHAACPWMFTWDDHEVDNDYANDISEQNDDPRLFLARRAAAYQACYENMPLPRRSVPFGAHMRLHTIRPYGDLVWLHVLDGRQYRDPHACPEPGKRGGRSAQAADCEDLDDESRSMLGARQEAWLRRGFRRSPARWNLLAQQTVMTRIDEDPGDGEIFWTDNWNGYPGARRRLIEDIRSTGVQNPVALSGDVHAFIAASVFGGSRPDDLPGDLPEFVTTSISSQGVGQKDVNRRRQANPQVLHADSRYRGYTRIDIDRDRLQSDFVALDDVRRVDTGRRVQASYVVEAGRTAISKA
jgi:alkaline phosphatase D